MCCRIVELRNKEVVCKSNGLRLGSVFDVEIDTCSGKLVSIIVLGKPKCFGLLGREEDIVIPWEMLDVIGEDIILISENYSKGFRYERTKNRDIQS